MNYQNRRITNCYFLSLSNGQIDADGNMDGLFACPVDLKFWPRMKAVWILLWGPHRQLPKKIKPAAQWRGVAGSGFYPGALPSVSFPRDPLPNICACTGQCTVGDRICGAFPNGREPDQ